MDKIDKTVNNTCWLVIVGIFSGKGENKRSNKLLENCSLFKFDTMS
jgi:hypothetical protein